MYKELIEELTSRGVLFDNGLTNEEVKAIESRYNITFPRELLRLYSLALPISNGFYNWRSKTEENTKKIKHALEKPRKDLIEEINEIQWNDNWGVEPDNEEERKEHILRKMQNAPKMIPIYSHRYMAEIEDAENPIFSICGSDIICYGKNLNTYLQSEFKIIEKPQVLLNKLIFVPFWSDLL